jgi:hypothetical protein
VTLVFQGRVCTRCGGTERLVSTGRCRKCNTAWVRRSNQFKKQRKERVNTPCDICSDLMHQPCYDENPVTGEPRGWLCHHCNRGLGMFRDKGMLLQRAVEYLENHEQ